MSLFQFFIEINWSNIILSFSVSAKNHIYLTWNRSGGWNGIYICMRVFRQHGK